MADEEQVFLFLAPDVRKFFTDNDISFTDVLRRAGVTSPLRHGQDPTETGRGTKEPATILLASAAVIVAATPILRQLIHNLTGRNVVVSERRLVPVEDTKGNVVCDSQGTPVLHWVELPKGLLSEAPSQITKIKGFGIEISLGEK
jgi:hypothetical protein